MSRFEPDYRHVVDAAFNREARRMPLYEHGFDTGVIKAIMGFEVQDHLGGDLADKTEAYRRICRFAIQHGYDCIPFEMGVTRIIQGGQGLRGQARPIIATMADVDAYPWDQKPAEYVARFKPFFDALRAALPDGMKAVGGVGNGLFETIQDFVPFQDLAFLQADEPEAYAALWQRIGDLQVTLWRWVLATYPDCFAVCRFGDDLGFRSSTLIPPDDIRQHILPQYKRVVDLVHAHGKPFLLHSCGRIYAVMDDLIDRVGIDAKHSNEDAIDPFDVWVERYGNRIGNFGGVEMNVLTLATPAEVKAYVRDLLHRIDGHGGLAIGTGNQISSYSKPENFIAMTEAVREWRGEHRGSLHLRCRRPGCQNCTKQGTPP
jgi:uroporphyrinogen decarboxylase